jgi:hypothetical protein
MFDEANIATWAHLPMLHEAESVEWSVELKIAHTISQDELIDVTDDLLEQLAPYSASASTGPRTMTVRLTVQAKTPVGAVQKAMLAVGGAFSELDRVHQLQTITRSQIETMEELEDRLAHPPVPEIIGVAELAEMLHVSKQRVSYLAHASTGFPKPFTVLASGPVWIKPNVMRFVETWVRRPRGRPRKGETNQTSAAPLS